MGTGRPVAGTSAVTSPRAPLARSIPGPARDAAAVAALVALLLSLSAIAVIAGSLPAWGAAAIFALMLGWWGRVEPARTRLLVLAAVPATALTGSAIVPTESRYVPALVMLGASVISSLGHWRDLAQAARRAMPVDLSAVVLAYLLWIIVATAAAPSSIGVQYVAGTVAALSVGLVVSPWLLDQTGGRRAFVELVALLGPIFVVFGLAVFLLRGIALFGNEVGLYFISELVVLGWRSGLVFVQNYGPFAGPSADILAFAVVGATWLFLVSGGRRRAGWAIVLVTSLLTLVATFSREGMLMASIGLAVVFVGLHRTGRREPAVLLVSVALAGLALASAAGLIGVTGRLDLVERWYGEQGVAVLMDPDVAHRGRERPDTVPGTDRPAFPELVELKTTSSFQARLALWGAALEAARARPWFGYGLGSNADAIAPYLEGTDARLVGAQTHSTPLRMLVETGIVGLAIYVAFLLVVARMILVLLFEGEHGALLPVAGCLAGILFHQLFGTLLLGGLSFGSYAFVAAAGLVAWGRRRPVPARPVAQ